MQFKAQHDVPIYTNPADQLPLDGSAPAAGSNTTAYEGTHAASTSNTATFGSYGSNTYSTPPITDETPVAPAQPEAPVSTYRGSHEASSPEEARIWAIPRSAAAVHLHRLPHRSLLHRLFPRTRKTALQVLL